MADELTPRFDGITIFETENGKARLEVRFEHDNVWLTQKLLAELYECSPDTISMHLKYIFKEGELQVDSVAEESSVTVSDGKKYWMKLYTQEEYQGRLNSGSHQKSSRELQ
jgi:hypothetical protein